MVCHMTMFEDIEFFDIFGFILKRQGPKREPKIVFLGDSGLRLFLMFMGYSGTYIYIKKLNCCDLIPNSSKSSYPFL